MSNNISNPIPAAQVVNVNLDWKCLTPPTCLGMEDSLQAIVTAICELTTVDGSCLGATTFVTTIEALIAKACETVTTTTTDPVTYTINSCTADSWDCETATPCITANTTDPEELMQIAYNAIVSLRNANSALCDRVAILESQVSTIQLQLSNGCC